MRVKVRCTCTICVKVVSYDNGQEFNGRMLTEKTQKKHIEADTWRQQEERLQEEAISSSILLAAASPALSRQGSMSLPVRRRDSELDVSSQRRWEANAEVSIIFEVTLEQHCNS